MEILSSLSLDFPLIGLIISILICLGFFKLGLIITNKIDIKNIVKDVSFLEYQYVLIGINFIIIFLFPIVLFFKYSVYFLYLISVSLLFLGLSQIFDFFKLRTKIIFFVKNQNLKNNLISIFIFIYFILSLSPITHADSLDYHISVAKFISIHGSFPTDLNNIHNLVSGAGEVLMSLGYVFNAEQIGNLIQFSGLLSLVGLVRKHKKNEFIYSLLILSTPVILFLCSSPKPQLFPIASNALIFTIIFSLVFSKKKLNIFDNKKFIFISFFILILLINSVNIKFSFILSSTILYILTIYFFFKEKKLIYLILISIIFFISFYLPFLLWKVNFWGGNLVSYLYNPFPNDIASVENFKNYLINHKRNLSFFNIFIPKNFGDYTNVMGFSILSLLSITKLPKLFRFILASIFIFYFLIVFNYGQISSRFLIEPLFWLIIIMSKEKININPLIKYPIYLQSCLTAFFVIFGIYNLTPGSFNNHYYDKVMSKSANGYLLHKWSSSVIKDKSKIISMHRSVSFINSNYISTTFLWFLGKDESPDMFVKQIEKQNPKYLLTYEEDNNNNQNISIFKNCVGKLVSKEDKVGRLVGRNPFNQGPYYTGYIYKLKTGNLLSCINKKY